MYILIVLHAVKRRRSVYNGTSGGAIYHTGSLRLSNISFVANEVGIEGPAIISIGFLEEMSNVYFSENTFDCRAREYGYIDKNEGVAWARTIAKMFALTAFLYVRCHPWALPPLQVERPSRL
eukprot:jgi/Undpi1/13620/HiC_scaffold_9.g03274.m1